MKSLRKMAFVKHITKKWLFLALLLALCVCSAFVIHSLSIMPKNANPNMHVNSNQGTQNFNWGEWVNAASGSVAALAAVIMAVFTWAIKSINSEQLSHTQKIERAYLSGGGDLVKISKTNINGPYEVVDPTKFWWDINNNGKTVAYLTHYAVEWRYFNDLVKPQGHWDAEEVYKSKKPYDDTIEPGRIGKATNAMENIEIPETGDPVIYGRFWYQDIWRKETHIFSFIQRIRNGKSYSVVDGVHRNYRERT